MLFFYWSTQILLTLSEIPNWENVKRVGNNIENQNLVM